MNYLEQDVMYLKGVGPLRAKALAHELHVRTVGDLLGLYPSKYVDRSEIHTIRSITAGMTGVQLLGRIADLGEEGEGSKRRLLATFTDGTGWIRLIWFRSIKSVKSRLQVDTPYLVMGRPTEWGRHLTIAHPEIEPPEKRSERGKLEAHYPLTEGLRRIGFSSRRVAELLHIALERAEQQITETLPRALLERRGLMSRPAALRGVHFPDTAQIANQAARRLKYEELFFLQLSILRRAARHRQHTPGVPLWRVRGHFNNFYRHCLPFPLTDDQKRVVHELQADMASGRQMNRLLQGDVGSGKTVVALMACLLALDNEQQACLMAPTELLAEQHYATLSRLAVEPWNRIPPPQGYEPPHFALLTGSTPAAERRRILTHLAAGQIDVLIGTHALIEPAVRFRSLALAVIDEQHRFGVKQRAALWQKSARRGTPPHVLVMTATPIPRTLAMTVWGDLDVSVIRSLPAGRKPVKTLHIPYADGTARERVARLIQREVSAGRQAYVVFPLIEESEKLSLLDLENGWQWYSRRFPALRVGRLHGRMAQAEKEQAMAEFSRGETNLLVSTTVIEVGVDVPNASLMVVENAERFGLSQLHQLRGRVGRGSSQSYCALLTGEKLTEGGLRRMQVLCETTDGFQLAEADMRLRGPGDIDGTQQSGLPLSLRIAHLVADADLMAQARDDAAQLLEQDPTLSSPELAGTLAELQRQESSQHSYADVS